MKEGNIKPEKKGSWPSFPVSIELLGNYNSQHARNPRAPNPASVALTCLELAGRTLRPPGLVVSASEGGWGRHEGGRGPGAGAAPPPSLPAGLRALSRFSAFALAVVTSLCAPPSFDPRPGGARLLRRHPASSLPRSFLPGPPPFLLPLLAATQDRRPGDKLWVRSQVRPGRATQGATQAWRQREGGVGWARPRGRASCGPGPSPLAGPSRRRRALRAARGPGAGVGARAGAGAVGGPHVSTLCAVLRPLPSRGTWCQFPVLFPSQVTSYSLCFCDEGKKGGGRELILSLSRPCLFRLRRCNEIGLVKHLSVCQTHILSQ